MTQVVKVYGQGDVRLEAYERPPTGPRDVVVKLKVAGICGSDLMYIRIGGIPPGHVTAIGHEAAGIVTEVGNEVEGITVGMRVVVNPMKTPSNIGSGGPEGAFTQELLVRDAKLGASVLPIPDDIPYEIAALCEPLAVAMHGVNRADVKAGDKRLERARALGIRAAFDPTKVSLREELTKLHGEVPSYNRLGVGTDAFIDAAGAPNILSDVVMMAKYHSRLVITAAHMKPLQFPVGRMLTSEMTITTAVGYPTEMPEVMAAMPRLQSKIASLISHRLAFQNILDGLKVAGTPSSAKVIVEFD
ncbi:hypothetical protein PInf_015033 [Phytophthora infestans]|nr:hypothetical protein PInf_015033 [Phytophthora infestans]